MFDPSHQLVSSADVDELDAVRRAMRRRLDDAGVHPVLSREIMFAFSEITIPRETGTTDGVKVVTDLAIRREELVLRVQTANDLAGSDRERGEQDLMLHLLADDVQRVIDGDDVVVTIRKRRLGR